MGFSAKIKIVRNLLQLSQAEMGKIMGVSQNAYCNYEQGKREPPIEKIKKLSQIGINIDWLITGNVNQNHYHEITATLQLNRASVGVLAKKLNVPEPFMQAIIDRVISPSEQFFARIMREGFGVEPHGHLEDDIQKSIAEIEKLRRSAPMVVMTEADCDRMQRKFDDLAEEYAKLLTRLREREAEIATLKQKLRGDE